MSAEVETVSESVVREWVADGRPFVFWRPAGGSECRGVRCDAGDPEPLPDVVALNGRSGFVFAPFRTGGNHPVWLLPPVEEVRFDLAGNGSVPSDALPDEALCAVPEADYARRFARFSAALHSEGFEKLVLSHRRTVRCPADFSPADAFLSACRRYIYSYVYMFYTPRTGYWLGATPELLLSVRGSDCRTVALAGTQPLKGGAPASEWSDKNIREQQYVTDYLCERLHSLGILPVVSPAFTARAGALAHLKTEVSFVCPDTLHAGHLLSCLHPTPAVCGVPGREALRFICRNEGYRRGYYSGFLGGLDLHGATDLYVNIRCMRLDARRRHAQLFAGGGLLPSSRCGEEWTETERKMQTMAHVLRNRKSHVYG